MSAAGLRPGLAIVPTQIDVPALVEHRRCTLYGSRWRRKCPRQAGGRLRGPHPPALGPLLVGTGSPQPRGPVRGHTVNIAAITRRDGSPGHDADPDTGEAVAERLGGGRGEVVVLGLTAGVRHRDVLLSPQVLIEAVDGLPWIGALAAAWLRPSARPPPGKQPWSPRGHRLRVSILGTRSVMGMVRRRAMVRLLRRTQPAP